MPRLRALPKACYVVVWAGLTWRRKLWRASEGMCGHLVVSTAVYRTGPCSERLPPAHWSRESDPKAGFPFPRVPSGQHGPSGVGLGKSRSQRAGNWGTPSPGPEGPTSPVKGEGLRAAAAVGYAVPGSWFRVPGSWFLVPGSGFLVPGSAVRAAGYRGCPITPPIVCSWRPWAPTQPRMGLAAHGRG